MQWRLPPIQVARAIVHANRKAKVPDQAVPHSTGHPSLSKFPTTASPSRGMTCDIHSLWSRFGFASCFCLRQVSERMTTCGSTYPTGCCCYCTNSEIKKLTGLRMQWLTQYSRPQGNPCYFFFRNCTFLLEFVRQPITCTQSQCPHERSAKVPMNSLGS